jgi:hypothetical protein
MRPYLAPLAGIAKRLRTTFDVRPHQIEKARFEGFRERRFTLLVIARTYFALRQGGWRELHVALRLLDRMATHRYRVLPNCRQALGNARSRCHAKRS